MTDLVQILSRASRTGGAVKGTITAVDTTTGRVTVSVNGGSLTATVTDQTSASASVGVGALLIPVGQTYVLAATMGGAIVAPNLVPNGKFSNPGDGLPPSGWHVSQDGSASLVWQANATAGPSGGWCGEIMVSSMGSNTSLAVANSPNFTIDPNTSYTLSFDAICDATVTNCVVWPSLQCFSTGNTWWGSNLSNGVLSPNVGSAWGTPYTTVLTIPDALNQAYVNLGIFCDTTSTGNIYLANVSLRKSS